AAALLLIAVSGWHSVVLVLVIAVHVVVIVMGLWLALAHRGAVRLLGVAVIVAAQVTAWVLEIRAGLLWAVTVVWVLLAVSVVAGVAAVRRGLSPDSGTDSGPGSGPDGGTDAGTVGSWYGAAGWSVPPPRRPYVIMNPRSGGGK